MLEDFKQTQPIIYQILKNSIERDEFSHAYLFEINGFIESKDLINAFIKSILCPNNYINNKKCGNCHHCDVIMAGNFPELKIIKPKGIWIKKEQLNELQKEYNEKAIIGKKRVYIIYEAEKLGISSANSLLKFLEEPEDGIIAILVTENIYNVIETIRSRCQTLRMIETPQKNQEISTIDKIKNTIYLKKENGKEIVEDELTTEKIKNIIEYVNYYELNHKDTLLLMNKNLMEQIKTKDDLSDAFDIISLYYKDLINIKLNVKPDIFQLNNKNQKIIDNNTVENLCKKLKIVTSTKNNIKYNANTNLLLDKLIIDLEGGI